MKIGFIPAYGLGAASSRIRIFYIARELELSGLAQTSLGIGAYDLHVFQKVDMGRFQTFQTFGRSSPCVFDYDDDLPQLIPAAAARCRAITVDTQRRLHKVFPIQVLLSGSIAQNREAIAWIEKYPLGRVVPDCIDYCPVTPMAAAPEFHALCWFGNPGNYNCEPIANAWAGPVVRIERKWAIAKQDNGHPLLTIPWRYESFPETLRWCGVAMLSHSGQDQAKSNNKLIAAVTLGVPCIVGAGSPEYEALLHEVGLGAYICSNGRDVRDSMNELIHEEARHRYLAHIQPLVWERYRIQIVARQALEVYKEALDG